MKITITGATGALGSVLVKHFSKAGHDVLAVGRAAIPPSGLLEYARYYKADVSKPFTLPKGDVCIHAAALSDDKGLEADFIKANVDGTLNTMRAAVAYKTFIQVSSSSVYMPADEPISEGDEASDSLSELSVYGRSKLLAEHALKQNFEGERCFILRPRSLYGPADIKIFPRILQLVKTGTLKRPGKMEINISLTHYSNFCRAIDLCIESDKKGISIYNVSDNESYRLIDVVRKIITSLYGTPLPERQTPIWLIRLISKLNIGGITPLLVRSLTCNMVLDISKIKRELGYSALINFDEALPAIAEWTNELGGVEVLRKADKSLPWK